MSRKMRTIIVLGGTLTLLGAVSVNEDLSDKVESLERRVEALETRLKQLEMVRKLKDDEIMRRLEKMDAEYQRTLAMVAELRGDQPEEVGTAIPPEVEPHLVILKNNYAMNGRFSRRKAIHAIESYGRDAIGAVPTLIMTLKKDQDRFSRQYAAHALGVICAGSRGLLARKAIRALNAARLGDPEKQVRDEAQKAIRKILD